MKIVPQKSDINRKLCDLVHSYSSSAGIVVDAVDELQFSN